MTGRIAFRELLIPVLMVGGTAAYWIDAGGLSLEAKAFPLALTAVIAVSLAFVLVRLLRGRRSEEDGRAEGADAEGAHWPLRAALVLGPVLAVLLWGFLGATLALMAYAAATLFILGERKPLRLVLLPAGLCIALVYLFRSVLYLRLPEGLLGGFGLG